MYLRTIRCKSESNAQAINLANFGNASWVEMLNRLEFLCYEFSSYSYEGINPLVNESSAIRLHRKKSRKECVWTAGDAVRLIVRYYLAITAVTMNVKWAKGKKVNKKRQVWVWQEDQSLNRTLFSSVCSRELWVVVTPNSEGLLVENISGALISVSNTGRSSPAPLLPLVTSLQGCIEKVFLLRQDDRWRTKNGPCLF